MVYWLSDNQALCYARLVDGINQSYSLKNTAKLYIPYPSGITKETADLYAFSIEYPILDGDKTYSSADTTLTATDYGLMIEVDEVVPFKMLWKRVDQQVPETDDSVIVFPSSVKVIQEQAFQNCSFECVILSEGCQSIEAYAFAGNTQLKIVEFPASIEQIDSTAFANCRKDLTFVVFPGSIAETHAAEHSFSCVHK